jgi:hypothetical protein
MGVGPWCVSCVEQLGVAVAQLVKSTGMWPQGSSVRVRPVAPNRFAWVVSSVGRAFDCRSKGQGFETPTARQFYPVGALDDLCYPGEQVFASVAQWIQSNGLRSRGSGVRLPPDAPV